MNETKREKSAVIEKTSWNKLTNLEKRNVIVYPDGILAFSEEFIDQMKENNDKMMIRHLKDGVYDNNPVLLDRLNEYRDKGLLTEEEVDKILDRQKYQYTSL